MQTLHELERFEFEVLGCILNPIFTKSNIPTYDDRISYNLTIFLTLFGNFFI